MKPSFFILLLIGLSIFSSCTNETVPPGVADPFVGNYAVAETSPTIPASTYTIGIAKAAGQDNTLEISNFGNFLKKNVLATVDGTAITIPSQVFTSNTGTKITITGSGKLEGPALRITYQVRGSFSWDATCVSTRN